MKRNFFCGLILFIMTISLAGCCGGGGGKGTTVITPDKEINVPEGKSAVIVAPEKKETVVVPSEGSKATAGKQLQDLKAAHDQGAITDEEFEKAKEKILKAE